MAEEHEIGTVKWYSSEKGYGFIGREGAEDVFVGHVEVERASLGTLKEGDRLSFTVRKTQKGFQAENLTRVGDAPRPKPDSARPPARPDATTKFKFGPDYLKDGYFDDKGYLRPEVLDTTAMEAAKRLGNAGMKPAQLRRFFNKARGIEARLSRKKDFEAVKADILSFKSDVVYQVGRKVVPDEFKQFIDRNVELAVAGEKSFKEGFLQHFQSVLAYFVYYFRE